MVLPWQREKKNKISSWDTGWLLEDFHWIFTPPILSAPSFGLHEKVWMETLLSSPLLPCTWYTSEVPFPSWVQWINVQPWQLGRMGGDGEAEPSWCQ